MLHVHDFWTESTLASLFGCAASCKPMAIIKEVTKNFIFISILVYLNVIFKKELTVVKLKAKK